MNKSVSSSGFLSSAAGTIYGFLTLNQSVTKTVTHPFKNIKATVKLLLYLFLLALILCRLTGRDCSSDVQTMKITLNQMYEKLKEKSGSAGQFITEKFGDIRRILGVALAGIAAGGSNIFERLRNMFRSKEVRNEVRAENITSKILVAREVLSFATTEGASSLEIAQLKSQIAQLKLELEQTNKENIELKKENLQIALLEAAKEQNELEIARLTTELASVRSQLHGAKENVRKAQTEVHHLTLAIQDSHKNHKNDKHWQRQQEVKQLKQK